MAHRYYPDSNGSSVRQALRTVRSAPRAPTEGDAPDVLLMSPDGLLALANFLPERTCRPLLRSRPGSVRRPKSAPQVSRDGPLEQHRRIRRSNTCSSRAPTQALDWLATTRLEYSPRQSTMVTAPFLRRLHWFLSSSTITPPASTESSRRSSCSPRAPLSALSVLEADFMLTQR